MLRRPSKQQSQKRVRSQSLPEWFADRQLAFCDIIQPELIHHCITIVKGEGATV